MGQLNLILPDHKRVNKRVLSTVHMCGFDGVPWPSRVSADENNMIIHRNVSHSGRVCLAYPVLDFGELTICTGTLPERNVPFHLVTELARGTLNRLRNQTSMWSEGGLKVPEKVRELTEHATELLAKAVIPDGDVAATVDFAEKVIGVAITAMFDLCEAFTIQVSKIRAEQDGKGVSSIGICFKGEKFDEQHAQQIVGNFEYLVVPVEYGTIGDDSATDDLLSFCNELNVRPMLGPLIDARPGGLPTSLVNGEIGFEEKRQTIIRWIADWLEQIGPKLEVGQWIQAVSGLNPAGHRELSYPQQLQLTVDIVRTLEEGGAKASTLIGFEQPWGEKLAWMVGGAHPLQIADVLLRHGISLGGMGIEIDLDLWFHGSLMRDPLQWVDMIDTWSQFGLPLFVFLRLPTGYPADAVKGSGFDRTTTIRDSLDAEKKLDYIESIVGLLLARPIVEAVIWQDWRDRPSELFPYCGLYDEDNSPKPIWHRLVQLKQRLTAK